MGRKHWTKEEDELLIENHKTMTTEELSELIGRSTKAVYNRTSRLKLDRNCNWTREEDEYLLSSYGNTNIKTIEKYLNRNYRQIKHRIIQLEGTSTVEHISNNLTTKEVAEITGVSVCSVQRWIQKKQIPHVKVCQRKYLIIESSFWNWLKKNLHKVNFKNIHDDIEMIVPKWYREEIKLNKKNFSKSVKGKCNTWTQFEETTAWDMFVKGYENKDIANKLDRTLDSVKGKMIAMKRKKLNKVK